jgi:hypothetical protein
MNEGGPRPVPTFGRTVQTACLHSIRYQYPTWHIDRDGGDVTAVRGDHEFREPGTFTMWAKLAVAERAARAGW